jgi:hypothetical protein
MINSKSLNRKREIRKNIKPLPPRKLPNISNSKTKSKSTKINPLQTSLKNDKMIFKKLPVKIEDIKNILSIPFKKVDHNNNVIKSLLFKKYTSNYDENIELLRINIEDGRDGEYKEYYKYLEKIRTHLDNYDIFKIVN